MPDHAPGVERDDGVELVSYCSATVLIKDTHWGGFRDKCELQAGHRGDHRTARTACVPVAYLGWPNEEDR